jgi:hypothetical protein
VSGFPKLEIVASFAFAALAPVAWPRTVTAGDGVKEIQPIATLAPSDVPPPFGTAFGASVAVWGDWIAVGAPADPWYSGLEAGAVYVFRRLGPTWIQHAKLTDPDGTWLDHLGASVAIEGDVIVAGAPHFETTFPCCGGPGAVYVYRRDDQGTPRDLSDDTWYQEARLTPPNPAMGDMLGFSVAISGDTIVAGSPYHSKAEVFRRQRDSWLHEATFDGADPDGNSFGYSVDIEGNLIVAGAPEQDDGTGSAYVFRRHDNIWTKEATLTASDGGRRDDFGRSVAISDYQAIAGARGYDGPGLAYDVGAAYLFQPTQTRGWEQEEQLVPSAPANQFGHTVALDRDVALVLNVPVARADIFNRMNKRWEEGDDLVGFDAPYELAAAICQRYAVVSTRVYVVRNPVSLREYFRFQNCFNEMSVTGLSQVCQSFDLTADGRVALDDFEQFMGAFAGP